MTPFIHAYPPRFVQVMFQRRSGKNEAARILASLLLPVNNPRADSSLLMLLLRLGMVPIVHWYYSVNLCTDSEWPNFLTSCL